MSNPSVATPITDTVKAAKKQALLKKWAPAMILPMTGIFIFLVLWQMLASNIHTSLGQFPGPIQVYSQASGLLDNHFQEQEKAAQFYARQEKRNAETLARDPQAKVQTRAYTGKPSFFAQIFTSLYTVLTGFAIAALIAVPLGIVCGLSKSLYTAVNPLIQLFKPVSPLAWLPLVTMVVSAVYTSTDPLFAKSLGRDRGPVLPVANGDQHHGRGGQHRQGPAQRQPCAEPVAHQPCKADRLAGGHADDFHRPAPVPGHRLDGADRRGNAGAEPRPGQIHLG